MSRIIACIDGSAYAEGVCHLAAWAHQRTKADLSLLHVVAPHASVSGADRSGQIGLGAKSSLLEELTRLDEEQGRLSQRKGQLHLEQAERAIIAQGCVNPERLHRRGTLVETIKDKEEQIDLVIMGKRGELYQDDSSHLGTNLERLARVLHRPLLVATRKPRPIKKILIAYDGSASAMKAVNFAASHPLLKGLDCHVLQIVQERSPQGESRLADIKALLQHNREETVSCLKQATSLEDEVMDYIREQAIDLLLIGAYGHSKMRNLFLGSTTKSLILKSKIPLLLFH